MKILVVGSGGREHSLCWALKKSQACKELFCAPGNGGTQEIAENIDIKATDVKELVQFSKEQEIDFVVVGPEAALEAGLVDALQRENIKVFGPDQKATQLESSKAFMKKLCTDYNIPTAKYDVFNDLAAAKKFAASLNNIVVVKADGLADGKGVILCQNASEVESALNTMMVEKKFGAAADQVLIEEFLDGEEASFFALCDGENILPLIFCQDHKQAFDGGKGPNTGGMGAYAPAPVITPEIEETVMQNIIHPTVRGMRETGAPFKGVLYAGLMITRHGPKLLEYNVRFGDPECQVIMLKLASDFLPALIATCDGTLDTTKLEWRSDAVINVVVATKGYPGSYEKGSEIKNLTAVKSIPDVTVFHAGTKKQDSHLVANGGRVLNVCATGANLEDAQRKAYRALSQLNWPQGFYRKDIGWRAIKRNAA